jgi:hypothetical protein
LHRRRRSYLGYTWAALTPRISHIILVKLNHERKRATEDASIDREEKEEKGAVSYAPKSPASNVVPKV